MNAVHRLSFVGSAIALALATAQADDKLIPATDAEVIVVTATRVETPAATLPQTITVIEGETLRQQIALSPDVSQILGNLIPSFSPNRQKLSGVGESFRGRNPLYLLDGVPQSTPLRDDGRDAHTVAPFMIERIEVVHGASAIQGMGATGGIINIITKKPQEDGVMQSAQARVALPDDGDTDGLGYGIGYMLSARQGQWEFSAAGHYQDQGIQFDGRGNPIGPDPIQGDLEDAKDDNLFLRLGWIGEQQTLRLNARRYTLESHYDYNAVNGSRTLGIATTAIKERPEGRPPQVEISAVTADYQHQQLAGGVFSLQLFDQEYEGLFGGGRFAIFQDPRIAPNLFDQSQNVSQKQGAKLTQSYAEFFHADISFVTGIDWLNDETYQGLVHTNRLWVPKTEYRNLAVFGQWGYELGDWHFSAGLRHERSALTIDDFTTIWAAGNASVDGGEPDFRETLVNVGAVWQISAPWRVYASYNEGFGMPDVGRILRAVNVSGQDVDSFLDLQPIVTENREIGVNFQQGDWRIALSLFDSRADLGTRFELESDGFYRVAREATEIQGLELDTTWALHDQHSIGLMYAYLRGEYDSNGDGNVDREMSNLDVAPPRANLYWQFDISDTVNQRLQWNYLFDRDIQNSAGNFDFEGYQTLDWLLSWQTAHGLYRFAIENLSDEFYFTHYAQVVGRNDQYFAGRGRTFSVTWSHDF